MIDLKLSGSVATIMLDELEPLSRHDIEFALELRDVIRDAADDDSVKVIILKTTGSDFCLPPTASDLKIAADTRIKRTAAWHAAYSATSGLYQNMVYCKKFIVTVTRGQCAGAGSMLVLCSDFTVSSFEASFEAPFAQYPESNLVLAELTMRLNRAKSWMLGGSAWSAEKAAHAGLINQAVNAADLETCAISVANAAAQMPLDGVAMTKVLLESFLDTQGVGQDFDMADFYVSSMHSSQAQSKEK
jgi:enoyl-CoA hydratase/carnithine racemase